MEGYIVSHPSRSVKTVLIVNLTTAGLEVI